MADQQKKNDAQNGEFKISPLGFDKSEVMAYIVQHNKARKALQEENEQLKKALEEQQGKASSEELEAEVEKKKAELDAQILESRKQILDERRKLAQTEKELHVLQDQYAALTEEYKEYKKNADQKNKMANKSGGAIDPEQLSEISAKANADANAIIDDAKAKANEIIAAAKAYFTDTVQKTYEYKQSVLAKADAFTADFKSGNNGAIEAATVNVFELLSAVAQEINDAVNSAIDSASEKAKQATEVSEVQTEEKKLADDESLSAARAELENIEGLKEGDLDSYTPMDVAPYNFRLKIDMPAEKPEAEEDSDLLSSFSVDASDDELTSSVDAPDLMTTEPAATPSVEIDDISDLLAEAPKAVPEKEVKSAPAPKAKPAEDDFSDLLTEAPKTVPEKQVKAAPAPKAKPAEDDFSDLLTEAPKAAPVPKAEPKTVSAEDDFSDLLASAPTSDIDDDSDLMAASSDEPKATDDFSDLLTSAPAPKAEPKSEPAPKAAEKADDDFTDLLAGEPAPRFNRAHEREGYGGNNEKLNESVAMGVAGKEAPENDPWKDLESQMNGLEIVPALKPKTTVAPAPADDDDGMTSSFDDAPVEQVIDVEEKIDMSDYSGMLNGSNETVANTSTAQFDPTWEFKMMEGITSDDEDDDEMSSDTGGFFDL